MPHPTHLLPSPFQDRISIEIPENEYIDVNGQAVPLFLSGLAREYEAFRNTVGLIDFSMLYKFEVSGPRAAETVNKIFSRDVTKIEPGSIAYGVVVDETGMMLDDCTVLVYSPQHVRLTGGSLTVGELLKAMLTSEQTLTELRSEIATLSVQGPNSRALLQSVSTSDWSNEAFPYYTFKLGYDIGGIQAHVNRMGFTAELGYEVMVPSEQANALWDCLIEAGKDFGAVPCAAAALMVVRVEAGMIMSGLEYDSTTSPYECRMGWSVDLEKGAFQGRDALRRLKGNHRSSIVSIAIDGPADELDGSQVKAGDEVVGLVTMAVASPFLGGKTIALARITRGRSGLGTRLRVSGPEGDLSAVVVATPVYDPDRLKVRS